MDLNCTNLIQLPLVKENETQSIEKLDCHVKNFLTLCLQEFPMKNDYPLQILKERKMLTTSVLILMAVIGVYSKMIIFEHLSSDSERIKVSTSA